MLRQSSLDAFNYIQRNNLLSPMRMKVYAEIVKWHQETDAPCTQLSIRKRLPEMKYGSVTGRFSELVEHGVIQEVGQVSHPDSKVRVLSYTLTDKKDPKPLKNKQSRRSNADLLRDFYKAVLFKQNDHVKDLAGKILTRMKGK